MRLTLLLAIVLLSPRESAAKDLIFRVTLGSAVVAHSLDLSSTVDCRARKTCREVNPWLLRYERPIPFALGKTTLSTLTLWATAEIYERCQSKTCRWSAIGLNIAQTVAFSAIAAHNTRVGK
jgi:hypothetical protein